MSTDATVVCSTCGMPVRVVFDEHGNIVEVYAVCGHVEQPERSTDDPT